MKFILTIYVCTIAANQCFSVPSEIYTYQKSHDTFDKCIKDGLGDSFEIFFNGDILKIDQINQYRYYPRFTCESYSPQSAPEAVEPSEPT